MIIICHIMQYLDMELAWWFNSGVQVFLCISGFLYSQKYIGEVTIFLNHRFRKILKPYFIVFIPYGILQFLFAKDVFNPMSFIRGLFINAQLTGGGHLWFVSTILMCYVLTPFLEAYRKRYVQDRKSFIVFSVLVIEMVSLFFGAFNGFFNPAWMSCYALGYAIGVNEKEQYFEKRFMLLFFGIVAAVSNGIQVCCMYIWHVTFRGSGLVFDYNHMLLGIFLFLAMKQIFNKMYLKRIERFLYFMDTYSYEIYLVHQFIILGPFSLMDITDFAPFNIMVILVNICILAWGVKYLERLVGWCIAFIGKAGV